MSRQHYWGCWWRALWRRWLTLTNDSYEGAEKAEKAQKLRFERVLWLDGMMS
jgi:hypothetical protein